MNRTRAYQLGLLLAALALLTMAATSVAIAQTITAAAAEKNVVQTMEPIKDVKIGPNREFLVNGKPFLPIMSWAQAPRSYKMLRTVGINTFCGGGHGSKGIEAAEAAGGYVVTEFGESGNELVGNPRLLGWVHRDEPDMPQRNQAAATPDAIEGSAGGRPAARFEPKEPPAVTAARYAQIKKIDSSRPVFLTFTGHFTTGFNSHYTREQQVELYPAYIKVTDVAGFDIYPIYGHGRPSWLNRPADAVAELVAMAGPRPVFAWIESHKGSRWMTYEKQPDVLPVHTRFQVWGCLIQGATAYGYFTHAWRPAFTEFAPTKEMQAEMLRVNSQVTRLAPAILAPAAKNKITMTMSGGLDSHFKATSYNGELYIFAQNRDIDANAEKLGQFDPINPRGGKATFTVAGLKAGTKIEVIDEDRTIVAENGKFTDDFAPLADHIYKMKL